MQKLFLHRNNPVRGQETVQGLFSRFWIKNRNKECLDLHGIQVLRLSWLFISWPGQWWQPLRSSLAPPGCHHGLGPLLLPGSQDLGQDESR